MKKTLLNTLTFVSLFFASTANAQVGVGVPAGDIHPSAELEVKSTEKGLLLPRMTKAQRIAIGSPATGLIVYQIDGDVLNPAGLYYFDGLIWKNGIGAQGVQGTAGAAGPQGPAGANGTNGATGPVGTAGSTGETGATGPVGPAGKDGKVEFQNFKVSTTGDTLYLTNGNYVIIPGISLSNPPTSGFGPAIVDIDGNNYKTVYIGKQHWMAENLKVSRFNDGTTIPNVTDISTWSNLTTAAWAYYNDEVTNVKYGKLYNWYTARGESNFQPFNITKKNVCPSGWHVPSNDEWGVLTSYLGGDELAGGKLKEEGATNWVSPNNNATNSTLFTGLPGGIRGDNGFYFRFGEYGFWWTSTENVNSTNNAWSRVLYNMDESAVNFSFDKNHGFSVRCLKN